MTDQPKYKKNWINFEVWSQVNGFRQLNYLFISKKQNQHDWNEIFQEFYRGREIFIGYVFNIFGLGVDGWCYYYYIYKFTWKSVLNV